MTPADPGQVNRHRDREAGDEAQATVRFHDSASRTGSVLLDDGVEIGYGHAAFDAGGLRMLRPGQRVRIRLGPDGQISFLTIVTLPDPSLPDPPPLDAPPLDAPLPDAPPDAPPNTQTGPTPR